MYVRTRRFARDRHCPHAHCIVHSASKTLRTFSGVWGGSFELPKPPLATHLECPGKGTIRRDIQMTSLEKPIYKIRMT